MFVAPASVIDSWPAPNYANPVKRSLVTLSLPGAIFLSIATTCLGVRLWTRIVVRSWFGLDDLFILLAWASDRRLQ